MDYNNNDYQQPQQPYQQPQQPQYQQPYQQQPYQQPPYQQPYQQPGYPQAPKQSNPMAIGALVCGIIGVVFCWFGWFSFVALVLSVIGIILGAKGMQVAKTTNSGKGLAIAGLVCGIVGTALSLIAVICYICVLSAANDIVNYSGYWY